jgi:heme-degrading monooxygenase HmoA
VISRAGHRAHLERSRWQLYREIESFLNGGDDISEPVHAVFFEVKPPGKKGREQYFAEVGALRSRLATMRGFIGVERFDNRTKPGWLLSLSLWRDESSLIAWREAFEHRMAQQKGRDGVFADYRIRVARQVMEGGDLTLAKESLPSDATNAHEFTSLTEANHHITLVETPNQAKGTHWRVIRDYGLRDRGHAPHE